MLEGIYVIMSYRVKCLALKLFYSTACIILLMDETLAARKKCKKVCESEFDQLKQRIKNLEDKLELLLRQSTVEGPRGEKGEKGEQGPRGHPGLPGRMGKDGALRNLPKCTAGEYITSDGTSLFCIRLGDFGKPFDITTPATQVSGQPSVIQTLPDVVRKNALKFYETDKIQSLYADTWDLHSFQWNGNTFLGVSQLSEKTFILFEWEENAFVEKSILSVPLARKWTSFVWKNELYIAIACNTMQNKNRPGYSYIYKLTEHNDVTLFQKLETATAFSVATIQQDRQIFVAFVSMYGRKSTIFKWQAGQFVVHSTIEVTGTDIDAFHIGNRAFLVVVGTTSKDPYTYLFEYKDGRFVSFQNLVMEIRPYGVTYVSTSGGEHFLAVAQYDKPRSVIFKWTENRFEEMQKVASCEARDFATTTQYDSQRGGNVTYLAVINYDCSPVIYVYDTTSGTFLKLQQTDSTWSRDMEFLRMPGEKIYLAVASTQKTAIYTGT